MCIIHFAAITLLIVCMEIGRSGRGGRDELLPYNARFLFCRDAIHLILVVFLTTGGFNLIILI